MACVAIHAVAARAVAAQAVAHGTAADGVFPPVSPLALQRATSTRVVAAEEATDEAVVALVAAVDVELYLVELKRLVDSLVLANKRFSPRLVDSRSPCTALEEVR